MDEEIVVLPAKERTIGSQMMTMTLETRSVKRRHTICYNSCCFLTVSKLFLSSLPLKSTLDATNRYSFPSTFSFVGRIVSPEHANPFQQLWTLLREATIRGPESRAFSIQPVSCHDARLNVLDASASSELPIYVDVGSRRRTPHGGSRTCFHPQPRRQRQSGGTVLAWPVPTRTEGVGLAHAIGPPLNVHHTVVAPR